MDTGEDTSESSLVRVSKKKKFKFTPKYNTNWDSDARLMGWVQSVPGNATKAFCNVCRISLNAHYRVLTKHSECKKHKINCDAPVPDSTTLNQLKKSLYMCYLKPNEQPTFNYNVNDDAVKRAEILWAACLAEHNIAPSVGKHIVEVAARAYADSETAQKVTLDEPKANDLIKNVIGHCHLEKLAAQICMTKFSIIVDESADIGAVKTLAICIRFFDDEINAIVTKFWQLVRLPNDIGNESTSRGNAARRCYNAILATFEHAAVPYCNIVGFVSDGCNILFNQQTDIIATIKSEFPGILINKCTSNSLHLCVSEACKRLPENLENLARNVYGYFKHNSKRQAEVREFQEFCETDPLEFLKPAQTRWLSLLHVVNSLLTHWEQLLQFFTVRYLENSPEVKQIINELQQPISNLYFKFLSHILPKFATVNNLFQSDKVVVNALHSNMTDFYRQLLNLYMDNVRLRKLKLKDIDPTDNSLFLPLENIYLSLDVNDALKRITKDVDKINIFKLNCRNFIITTCLEIKKRYNFGDIILPKIAWLSPLVAMQRSEFRPESIYNLASRLPRIVTSPDHVQRIDDLWRKFPDTILPKAWCSLDVDKFWISVKDYPNLLGEAEFSELGKFALDILVFPHSSGACERVFSKINTIKSKTQNELGMDSVNGTLLAAQHVQITGCNEFEPTPAMSLSAKFDIDNVIETYDVKVEET